MSRTVWLILPTYNEAGNLELVIDAAQRALDSIAPGGYRVLVVDDSSPDGTGAIADRLAAEREPVEVLHRAQREGLGPAYVAGFVRALAAGADLVVEMDSDLSHDPADIARLVAAIDDGADVALGSRYVAGGSIAHWGVLRRFISRGGCLYARLVLGLPIRDLTGGFKCFRARVLESIDLPTVLAHGYVFQVEMTLRAVRGGFRVVEVPVTFHDRLHGASKMSTRIAIEAAWLLPQLRAGRHLD
jgi:dolichol-phosphate mannosyltransferase